MLVTKFWLIFHDQVILLTEGFGLLVAIVNLVNQLRKVAVGLVH